MLFHHKWNHVSYNTCKNYMDSSSQISNYIRMNYPFKVKEQKKKPKKIYSKRNVIYKSSRLSCSLHSKFRLHKENVLTIYVQSFKCSHAVRKLYIYIYAYIYNTCVYIDTHLSKWRCFLTLVICNKFYSQFDSLKNSLNVYI